MTDLAITSAIESNYQGMIAMVGADHRVYLGKPENCYLSPEGDAPAYYDNSDHSLQLISDNIKMSFSPNQPGPANVPAGDVPGEVLHQSRLHRVCQPAGGSPLPISPDSGSDICRKAFCPAQGAPPYARFPSRSPRPLKPASIRGRFRLYPRNSPYIISERL